MWEGILSRQRGLGSGSCSSNQLSCDLGLNPSHSQQEVPLAHTESLIPSRSLISVTHRHACALAYTHALPLTSPPLLHSSILPASPFSQNSLLTQTIPWLFQLRGCRRKSPAGTLSLGWAQVPGFSNSRSQSTCLNQDLCVHQFSFSQPHEGRAFVLAPQMRRQSHPRALDTQLAKSGTAPSSHSIPQTIFPFTKYFTCEKKNCTFCQD